MKNFAEFTDATGELSTYIDVGLIEVVSEERERSDLQHITAIFLRGWQHPIMVSETIRQVTQAMERATNKGL